MAPKREPRKSKSKPVYVKKKTEESPVRVSIRDPSLPASIQTTSKGPEIKEVESESKCKSGAKSCFTYIYNPEKGTICDRTCSSWFKIIVYSIMYLIFLTTYAMICLYVSLVIIKSTVNFSPNPTLRFTDPLIYVRNGVGLSATPTAENNDGNALIWFTSNDKDNYKKYVSAIDELLISRRKSPEVIKSLGPCGQSPYGYSDKPCVLIRINKQLYWAGKPIGPNSTITQIAPAEVQDYVRSGKKMLWLHCSGLNPYDQEHIGNISYYPHPPGFDPKLFPLDIEIPSPIIAVQFVGYTRGVSVAVVCKLWYEQGPSAVHFTLYVAPNKTVQNSTTKA